MIDVYVSPKNQDLGKVTSQIEKIVKDTKLPEGVRVNLRGSVQGMRASFKSFGIGLILVGRAGVSDSGGAVRVVAGSRSLFCWRSRRDWRGCCSRCSLTGTTLNVMSLMGLVMMVGIVVSNSILIVEFARHLHHEGKPLQEAVAAASRLRLRPILMTSLATVLGLIPMALGLEAGSEQYAPLARAIIGGLLVSVVVTVYLVPAAYLLIHRRSAAASPEVTA